MNVRVLFAVFAAAVVVLLAAVRGESDARAAAVFRDLGAGRAPMAALKYKHKKTKIPKTTDTATQKPKKPFKSDMVQASIVNGRNRCPDGKIRNAGGNCVTAFTDFAR